MKTTLACGHIVDLPDTHEAFTCAACAEEADPMHATEARLGYSSADALFLAAASKYPGRVLKNGKPWTPEVKR